MASKSKKSSKKETKKDSKKKTYDPMKYVKVKRPGKAPAAYKPATYTSAYADRLDSALNTLTNWNYDPLKDARYQALAKIYGARGNIAAKDTLADAAALNGGMQTSYAVSAAQQARNQYNQELAALIPDLEANAFSQAQTLYGTLRDADDAAYARFRDAEADKQWQYTNMYNQYRDAMADYQWGKNYDADVFQYKQAQAEAAAKAKKSSGGGGRRRSGGGGSYGGYSSGASTSQESAPSLYDKVAAKLEEDKKKKTGNAGVGGGGGGHSARINKNVMMTK